MPSVLVRNLKPETHLALKARAKANGRSTEAEIREILDAAVLPSKSIGFGTQLALLGKEIGLTEKEAAIFDTVRDKTVYEPITFE